MNALVYWPEADRNAKIQFVGYNHAVGILLKAVGDFVSSTVTDTCKCRLYFNIPWHHDPAYLKKDGLPLVAYTMFESTKLPNHWRDFLNKECAACIVPTQFCSDVFRMSGVNIPIRISTLGIDSSEYGLIERGEEQGYNYLWQGHNYDPNGRKAGGLVETAFTELKHEGKLPENSKLYMKYRPHKDFGVDIDYLEIGDGIIHISKTMTTEELHDLYTKVDCCINPSRGEGFGLIPLEQMAMGFPVILTGWSFPFVNDRYNIPLKYELSESPVKWCHKHISFGTWGFDYTWNGLQVEHLMPRLLDRKDNGGVEYGADLKPVPAAKTIYGWIRDIAVNLQMWSGLYWKPDSTRHYIMFEHPGYDAAVDKNDLKDKMLYAFNNQDEVKEKGKLASQWVYSEWNLDRVKREFIGTINNLTQEGII